MKRTRSHLQGKQVLLDRREQVVHAYTSNRCVDKVKAALSSSRGCLESNAVLC